MTHDNSDSNHADRDDIFFLPNDIIKEILRKDPDNGDAWLWLSKVAKTDHERKIYLNQVNRIKSQSIPQKSPTEQKLNIKGLAGAVKLEALVLIGKKLLRLLRDATPNLKRPIQRKDHYEGAEHLNQSFHSKPTRISTPETIMSNEEIFRTQKKPGISFGAAILGLIFAWIGFYFFDNERELFLALIFLAGLLFFSAYKSMTQSFFVILSEDGINIHNKHIITWENIISASEKKQEVRGKMGIGFVSRFFYILYTDEYGNIKKGNFNNNIDGYDYLKVKIKTKIKEKQ